MRFHPVPFALLAGAACMAAAAPAPAAPAPADSAAVLPGGQEGKVFEDMTIQGENKIQIEFERPALDLDLDFKTAPGLDWKDDQAVLDNKALRLDRPLLVSAASEMSPYLARPWFAQMKVGSVARFHPEVEGVERWELRVANSKGEAVATFQGSEKTPKEISWDGMKTDGTPATPGLTYSYVFEAYDRAGNKRNFMGDGFELPPYCIENATALTMLFSAAAMGTGTDTPPLLYEAASRINQRNTAGPVSVTTTARSYDEAQMLSTRIMRELAPLLALDPAQLQPLVTVEADAPQAGWVRIQVGS